MAWGWIMRPHRFRAAARLLGIILLLFSSGAQASQPHQAQVSLIVGALRSNLFDVGTASWLPSGGALVAIPLRQPVAVTMGAILESRKGSRRERHDYGPAYLRRVSLGYLVFPLRIELGGGKAAIAPSFLIGLEAGTLLWANEDTFAADTGARYGRSTPDVYSLELSAAVGGRLNLRASGKRWFLEGTLFGGITGLQPSRFSTGGGDPGFSNSGLRVGVGVTI
jgi:hypothetical protein